MKILIVSANLCPDPYVVYPLGASVIAGTLNRAGYAVELFDLASEGSVEQFSLRLREFQPDVVAFSLRNIDTVNSRNDSAGNLLAPSLELIRLCKEQCNAITVLGGSAFSLIPETLLEKSGADYGVTGEGETAILNLVEQLAEGKHPQERLIRGIPGEQSAALYPDRIVKHYLEQTHIIPLQTKRGCPFHCVYCSYPHLEGHTLRLRNPEIVADELADLHERYPDAMFYLVDAVFNDPGKEFRNLLHVLCRKNISVPFAAFLTPRGLDEDDAVLLKQCGMVAAELGIDAASDKTLRGLGKNFDSNEARQACRLLTDHKISVTTNVMFGGPGETWDTVREGIENLRALDEVHTMIFSGIRILPDTPLLRLANQEGFIPKDWDPSTELYYFAPGIEPAKLHELLTAGFADSRHCIYPPQRKNKEIQMLHRIGYTRFRAMRTKKGSA